MIDISLLTDSGDYITNIKWKFKDWGYEILSCTPGNYKLKYHSTPVGTRKVWKITFTPEDVTIKCASLEVLHFMFNNTEYNYKCATQV